MKSKKQRAFWGFLLMGVGLFLLLNNFNVLGSSGDVLWTGFFIAAGLIGLGMYARTPKQWWILFPSFVFLGIGGTLATELLDFTSSISGGVMLFSLAAAFWIIFIREETHWWAAIPGGVLTSVGTVAALSDFAMGDLMGGVLFIGVGLTFALLWMLRQSQPTDWAKWPASILLVFGLLVPILDQFNLLWPLVLIGVGIWFLMRSAFCKKKKSVSADSLSEPLTNNSAK